MNNFESMDKYSIESALINFEISGNFGLPALDIIPVIFDYVSDSSLKMLVSNNSKLELASAAAAGNLEAAQILKYISGVANLKDMKGSIKKSSIDLFCEDSVSEAKSAISLESRYRLVDMKIDDFLSLVMPVSRESTLGEKLKSDAILSFLDMGEKIQNIPYLIVNNHQVYDHNGRHRALALKSLGYNEMLVILDYGNSDNLVDILLSERLDGSFVFLEMES